MKYADILHRCFRCGYCKFTSDYENFNCPSYRKYRFDTFAPGGRMWLIRAWLNGEIENSERFQEILYSCATCGSCVEHCAFSFKENLVNIFIAAREEMVNKGKIPPTVRDYFKAISIHGNPYNLPAAERAVWAENLPVETYNGQEYLFYVGCVGSYDDRGRKIAQAVSRVLTRAGVSFGILGKQEPCDGNEVRVLGEAGLFEFLVERNIALFRKMGVKKIITLDPHAYNAFTKDYREFGGEFEVRHYSQVLTALMESGKLEPKAFPVRATFHDPCYLGRHGGEYEAPRKILSSIPGIELVEMDQNRNNALCCGGGGGNFFTDILGGEADSPSRIRIRQALETGAELLIVSCPQCARMLEDAIKAEGVENRLSVKDAGELLDVCVLLD